MKNKSWILLLMVLLVPACTPVRVTVCPEYPVPSQHVVDKLHPVMEEDVEVKGWFNQLYRLQLKLEDCK